MRKSFLLTAILFCRMLVTMADNSVVLTDFYTYKEEGSGYKVGLTEGFKEQLNKTSGGIFCTWHTGEPLPNPAPNGTYNGKPVISLYGMFYDCSLLTNLDLTEFNTANVINMGNMFFGCSSLTSLYISNFNTENITNMDSMFYGCSALTDLDLCSFNIEKCTTMSNMFSYCGKITNDLPAIGYAKDATTASTFNKSAITSINNSLLTFIVATDFYTYAYFEDLDCYNVSLSATFRVQLDKASGGSISSGNYTWETGNPLPNPAPNGMYNGKPVISMVLMFCDCSNLTALDLSMFNTENITNMYGMFYRCSALTKLNLSMFNTENVTYMTGLFSGCSSLTSLDLSNFNTTKTIDMSDMFKNCSALTNLNLSSFNTGNTTNMNSMFYGCSAFASLDLSNFNTENVMDMSWMFYECSTLTSLDLSSFEIANDANINIMFNNCGKAVNETPAAGYVKNSATAEIFNNSSITYIDNSKLKFEVKSTNVECMVFSTVKTLQVRGEQLYNPTESEVTIYNIAGRRMFISKDININLSGLISGVYVASNKKESVKIVKQQ